ncbi:MAG: hypothetical protein HY722_14085 [Planctomycetes bacterium]|nr:hypothetical protein [Planctomycetota bacterium]
MSVSQQEIADRLGIDRTAVTKILNRTPGHFASKKTIDLVFKTARDMAYDFSRLRHTHGRRYERRPVTWSSELQVLLADRSVYDTGTGLVKNISSYGALMADLSFPKNAFPLEPFTVLLHITDGALAGVRAECEVIRFKSHPIIDIGLNIVQISEDDRFRIHRFTDEAAEEHGLGLVERRRTPREPREEGEERGDAQEP